MRMAVKAITSFIVLLVVVSVHAQTRAIDQSAREDFVVAETTFTFEKSAGDFSRRERLLLVLASQRKKIEARTFVARNCGDENDALAVADEHSTMRLLGEPTRFEGERLAVDENGFADK